jgi:hypothetical protein
MTFPLRQCRAIVTKTVFRAIACNRLSLDVQPIFKVGWNMFASTTTFIRGGRAPNIAADCHFRDGSCVLWRTEPGRAERWQVFEFLSGVAPTETLSI